jgi:hypothetical protein
MKFVARVNASYLLMFWLAGDDCDDDGEGEKVSGRGEYMYRVLAGQAALQ